MRCKTDDTLRYVQFLARRFDKHDVRAFILVILFDLGFTTSMDGFDYLRAAIELHYTHTSSSIVKGIYPRISYLIDDDYAVKNIDQAIRRAIQDAWNVRDSEIWDLFFPSMRYNRANCPTSKEFIARISCIIELWQSCKEADYDRAI